MQRTTPDALRDSGRGLLVRGRGAEHQADALGDLLLPSPFSLPIRLFVEAKNRGTKAQLRDVRNAQGVITDVNEHYSISVALSYKQPLRRFLYRYALFSTSGFTPTHPAGALLAEAADASDQSWLREELRAPTSSKRYGVPPQVLPVEPESTPQAVPGSGWSDRAVELFMHELDAGSYVHGRLIREAARRGGTISRADVYQVAGFPRNRTLRGLTRPPNRLTAALIRSGFVPEDAEYPGHAQGDGV